MYNLYPCKQYNNNCKDPVAYKTYNKSETAIDVISIWGLAISLSHTINNSTILCNFGLLSLFNDYKLIQSFHTRFVWLGPVYPDKRAEDIAQQTLMRVYLYMRGFSVNYYWNIEELYASVFSKWKNNEVAVFEVRGTVQIEDSGPLTHTHMYSP